MQVDDTGEHPGETVSADHLLGEAEHAFIHAKFGAVLPLLRRLKDEFGTPEDAGAAVRYAVLRAAMAARAGNWPEAARRCPDSNLEMTATGVVHALAVAALRLLSEDGGCHTDHSTAALAIVLWAHLLDEDDPGGFRALLTERRGASLPDDVWEEARRQLNARIAALLRALDIRADRDVLASWETAWEHERADPVVIPSDSGSDGLIALEDAAWHLVSRGRGEALLEAYAARHPDPATWTADSPVHRACANALSPALAERGRARVQDKKWSEALTAFSTSVRLGRPLDSRDRTAVRRAADNIGRGLTSRDYAPIPRIHGLELAHAMLPEDDSLASELTAELVRRGRDAIRRDPRESKNRFLRALQVSPDDKDARSGLDDLLKADLRHVLDGAEPGEELREEAVRELLRRDPDCTAARTWLRERIVESAVSAAAEGDMTTAKEAVHDVLEYDGDKGPYPEELISRVLVELLIEKARSARAEDTRAGQERAVTLLHTVAGMEVLAHAHIRDTYEAALLDLAEYLEAAASPSDVIGLFLRDVMRTGVSARFDRTVKDAYLRRARNRELEGDLGGARRDRACAQQIGAGLPEQGLLFGPPPQTHAHHLRDYGQETLF